VPDTYREQQKRIVNQLRAGSGQRNLRASIVPIRSDYETDPALCLTSVVFIPDEFAQDIHRTIVEPLREIEPDHHYYSPESMHVTIKNVRTVHDPPLFTETDIQKVHRLFSELVSQHGSFLFSLEEVVAFPTSVTLIGYCDQELGDLFQALDAGLREIGIPDNKRYVSDTVVFGNVTLCRYVRQPSQEFRAAVNRMAHAYRAEMKVEVIHLITCNSVCNPESRKIWHSYQLGGGCV
jgi:2'-5' RNA ligase